MSPARTSGDWEQVAARVQARSEKRSGADRVLQPAVLRFAGRVRQRDVLELGCGTGSLARVLAARGARVLGLDADADAVHRARADAADSGLAPLPEFRVGSLADPRSLPRSPHDLVVAVCAQPGSLGRAELDRIPRLLRSRGRLVLALAHPYRGAGATDAGAGLLEELFAALRAAGLRVVDLAEPHAADRKGEAFLVLLCERRRRRGPRAR